MPPTPQEAIEDEGTPPPMVLRLPTKVNYSIFPILHNTPSNKTGRKYMKPDGSDDFTYVMPASGEDWVCMTSQKIRALAFQVSEITLVRVR